MTADKKVAKKSHFLPIENERVDQLEKKITGYIDSARKTVQRTIDLEMVKAYWLSGRDIVEEEQYGQERAKYGTFLIKEM
jgi:hypothetical protein